MRPLRSPENVSLTCLPSNETPAESRKSLTWKGARLIDCTRVTQCLEQATSVFEIIVIFDFTPQKKFIGQYMFFLSRLYQPSLRLEDNSKPMNNFLNYEVKSLHEFRSHFGFLLHDHLHIHCWKSRKIIICQ